MSQPPQVGIGVLITKDDQVLLVKRSNPSGDGTWSPPGGKPGQGESFEACAISAAQKEAGVIISEIAFLAVTNEVFEASERQEVTIWMAGRYVSGPPTMHPGREMSEIDWFPWDTLPEPLTLPFEHLLTGRCYPGASGGRRRCHSFQQAHQSLCQTHQRLVSLHIRLDDRHFAPGGSAHKRITALRAHSEEHLLELSEYL